ncbi:MAG TPA: tetratricopeptide repeat protein, partial [Candidatus Obscuribacterales bacterium]
YDQAEPLYQRALAIREKSLGADHVDVGTSLRYLADVYLMQKKFAQAEPLYVRAIEIFDRTGNPQLAEVLENYASLLKATHRDEEAAKIKARAEAAGHGTAAGGRP